MGVSDEGVNAEQQGNKRASFGDILKESRGDVEVEKEGKVAMHEQDGMYNISLSLFLSFCWMDKLIKELFVYIYSDDRRRR